MNPGSTILVVEDSTLLLDLVTAVLRRQGYEVLNAVSAASALTMLATLEEPPALLISDLRLGQGIGGAELLRTAILATPGMKGILMSGAFDELPSDAPYSHLEKPFDPGTLLDLVARLLQ